MATSNTDDAIANLRTILQQANIQRQNQALYQVVNSLIGLVGKQQQEIVAASTTPGGVGGLLALAAGTLAGRRSTSGGTEEQITLGTGLSMSGTVLSATGGAGLPFQFTTVTNAQILTLPTTPVTLVSAPGVGKRNVPILIDCVADFTAGAYSNIDAASAVIFFLSAGPNGISFQNGPANDNTISMTQCTDFLTYTANKQQFLSCPFMFTQPLNAWGNLVNVNKPYQSGDLNVAYELSGGNVAGNFTGGNAANTMKITVWYVTVSY